MKILHILDHSIPLHSGYTFRTKAILEQQKQNGWKTVHVTSIKHTAKSFEEETVDGLHFYRTHAANSILSRIPVLNQIDVVSSLSKRLDQVIGREQPDILHAHSPSLNGLAALRAGKKHNIPVVYECRAFWEDAAVDHGTSKAGGVRYRMTRALETRVFQQADAVTTICEGLKQDISNRGIPADKITVIPNAVDIERFNMNEARSPVLADRLGLNDKLVLGFIGSFYAYEGLLLLVSAMPLILEQFPDTRLLLVGGGPQEREIQALVNKLDLHGEVIFTGRVPHNEVNDYYNLVDIFVYPRMHMRLTDLVTPLKPLEAMAQGKLVLASDVGGHKELIRDGENGRLFLADSRDSLAATTIAMMSHREQWDELKLNGRRYVEQERNWKKSVEKYRIIYKQLVKVPATRVNGH
ncbi:MAG: glycosyltransferase, exosortase A system-associated [Chromatiaceae bacterium]|nr:glycosyltransferase, exosortase A system-associated [Chromatiaceae bacterium]